MIHYAVLAMTVLFQPVSGETPSDAQADVDRDGIEEEAVVTTTSEEIEAAAQVDEPVICKRTTIVGSKFKKKVCGTPSEWAVMEGRSQDVTGQMQRRGKGMDPNGR
ncbi:hypothetical protein WJT74_01675 [Sphingomicrobium sp. XHP0239]|uniref:hypothetical protein n=1 Tax=Sphingomicrobium maritimum TaxID=3133972 RepID=UPI0031CC8262